ncbi:hypothetical protein C9J01_04105 [Photobacterium rosenbergii]|uniref:Uncharacterized protein n=1 Tax=Photobacterium rosenbergii TaxID=294936 RepID=A0A2T3NL48_9GAMM|nr:hypothetical protein [Photobacterium rosenbergii]PSW16193.1 hypothetical protein C9J01_04105 [Photobacterium rosenbergii]
MIEIDYLVNVVTIPADLIEAANNKNSDLYEAYKIYQILVESSLLWRVWYIDEYGKIWLDVNLVNKAGEHEFHTIALDEGTYVKVNAESYVVLDELK